MSEKIPELSEFEKRTKESCSIFNLIHPQFDDSKANSS